MNRKKNQDKDNLKVKKNNKLSKKAIIILVTIGVIFIALIAGGVFAVVSIVKNKNSIQKYFADVAASNEDVVMASGVISVGTVEESLDIDNMTTTLDIEEILFSSGDKVNEGDALIRFSSDSVAEAEKELAANLREKELSYRSGKIEYEQSLITAKANYDNTILSGEQADQVYEETVASLKDTLDSATKTYNEASEQLAEYKDAQANNTYYTDYKVEYYKEVYDDNLEVLKKKIEEWGVPWEEVTGVGARVGPDEYSQYKYVLQSLYQILEKNARDYDQAVENYENDQADLSYNLLSLQLNMSTLEETYLNAKKSYEVNLLQAEQTRQTAKTNAELAESAYEATVEKAETDYEKLLSQYEDAQSDYDTFKERIINNQYVAANSGTIMRSSVRGNDGVTTGSRIVMYSDLSEILVSVSVDQADISKLAVGDDVVCYSDSTGMLSGKIKSISPISQSTSISSVTYSVTVKIDSNDTNVSSNTSVTVIFGYDLGSSEGLDGMIKDQGTSESGFPGMDGEFNMDNMPDFSNMPGGGNMPDFGNMPNF